MKKLAMKNIALGLALAGYAASSAFAVDATTTSTIIGTAPLIQAKKPGAAEHTVDVKVFRGESTTPLTASDSVQEGDRIEVEYNVVDADGDAESAAGESAVTLAPYYFKDSKWVKFDDNAVTASAGKATFTLTRAMIGATKIGFKIQENTQYGAPSVGLWLKVGDIAATTNPGTSKDDPQDQLEDKGPGGETGPGPSTDKPIEESSTTKLGLFAVNAGGIIASSYNFAATSEMTDNPAPTDADVLKVGGTYYAIAWAEQGGKNHIPDGIKDMMIDDYTYTWQLTGTNTAAKGTTAAAATDLTTAQGIAADTKSITIGLNSAYADYEAGAQGFALKITGK